MKSKGANVFAISAAMLLCSAILAGSPRMAHAETPQWSGSVKSFDFYVDQAPADLFPSYWISSNQLRLNMDWAPINSWYLETAVEYQNIWSDQSEIADFPEINYNRHLDMEEEWQHGNHAASNLQVDRLNLQWQTEAVDTVVGRQAIGFGRILIYSPLDVIAPFAPDAIDTEVRRGVDALHSTFNYGINGQISAIAVWGSRTKYNSFLGTWSDNRDGLDLLMIGGQLRGRAMFGAGVAGNLGTLGLKGEFSIHDGRDTDNAGGDLHDTYVLGAIESWYRFDNGISLIAQYLYNGPGADNPEDYPAVLNSAPLQEGLTYLLGRNYLIIAPAYELHPLATLQGLMIYNIDDQSALIRPNLVLSLADNLSLQLLYSWHIGQQPRVPNTYLPAVPRSEFGSYGDSCGLFLSWYF
jgi:hypothetical protein